MSDERKFTAEQWCALITAARTGAVVRVTWVEAGVFYDGADLDSGVVLSEVTAGAAPTHTLEGDTLTLYSGANVARTVGFSLAGTTGTIAVTLPASTQTPAQIAALVAAAIEAHADFSAVQGTGGATAEVTVTNAALGHATNASAGSTGFTVAVLAAGSANTGLVYVLVDETLTASENGWRELPRICAFRAVSSGTQAITANVYTRLTTLITESYDTHGQYDAANSRFTCRVKGIYNIHAQLSLAVNYVVAQNFEFCLVRTPAGAGEAALGGGSQYIIFQRTLLPATPGPNQDQEGSVDILLNEGDILELYFYSYVAGITVNSGSFSASRIGNNV